MIRISGALAALTLVASAPAQTGPAKTAAADTAAVLPADQAAMRAHVMFLASDALRGREAGTPDYDVAAHYVAAQFQAAGLRPAGDAGSYLQHVPLTIYKAASEGTMRWTDAAGRTRPLVFGTDYIPSPNPARTETSVTAPVVFAGRGIVAPQFGVDDYRGMDVRGKIVAIFAGSPTRFPGEERAYFGSAATKAQIAAARGAIGIVMLDAPRAGPRQRPFAALVGGYASPKTTWAKPDGTGTSAAPTTPVLGTLSQAAAATLFEGAATPWSAIVAEAQRPDPTYTPVVLKGTLAATTRTSFTPAASSNVVGIVPGTDPTVGKEVVILSAHLDHIGVSPARPDDAPGRDRINNGALDNAIGIASLIEEAKRFATAPTRPKRTVMFLAVTGEEKGLIGSSYFVDHPTVPLQTIVADINLDMPVLLYTFEDMIAFGADRSSLGPIVTKAVNAIGIGLSPDPMPEQGFFTRSDHFNFVKKGIPSLFLWPGVKGAGAKPFEDFLEHCYHRPCDDLSQPILWDQGVRFVATNYAIARAVADAPQRPTWNKGDYFGTTYNGPMAQ
ncbi:aminopeptidase [Sphingomonas melonis]|uniref:Aminopeptidase n=1 Tax=Sphingomonas melonis TaxID=152682 RepID=A0A0D1KQ55_9SPHN|nr:M28 family metallopeptidase [Sphingomonas melonis]KIU26564.1 aminopeptidase [Sphingomonas melonis]